MAMYNVGQAGLTFWAPNINIFRDPRWRRGQETPSEDPAVAAAYSIEYVKGFQGESWSGGGGGFKRKRVLEEYGNGGSLMLSACCKHFTAYDLEDWGNFTRYTFNAKVRLSGFAFINTMFSCLCCFLLIRYTTEQYLFE